ncbi:X8 domain-containing protein [Citrus sinensis]|uniref:X8 domain-containing protein n=1 Tax=Citrus sinensis TaxID=2711 RepID=A0ACB8JY19_CITSI|nr:X8 domain-containing protein [Citrus sinensis]
MSLFLLWIAFCLAQFPVFISPSAFYQPPMAHPPPAGPPPPPHQNPRFPVWCVAKPTVPDSIIQEAMDYACGTGADCKPIQTNGSCFQPNTLVAHASYAFNSYWQKTKNRGGTCDFGGIAMLVTTDPIKILCIYACRYLRLIIISHFPLLIKFMTRGWKPRALVHELFCKSRGPLCA